MGWTSLNSIPRGAYVKKFENEMEKPFFGIKFIDVTKLLSRFQFPLYWTTDSVDSVDLDENLRAIFARRDIELLQKF